MTNLVDKNAVKGVIIINGQTLDLFNLQPKEVPMVKLVRGLQGVIRFNGYSGWSVAQHSYLLSMIVERATKELLHHHFDKFKSVFLKDDFGVDLSFGAEDETVNYLSALFAYDALIHDFSEALTGDIIRPFKQLVPAIREMEQRIDCQLREIHNGLSEMPLLVDVFDKQLATIEAVYLTRFDNRTIIDESDDFQVKAFNSAFISTDNHADLVADLLGFHQDFNLPLSNKNLIKFIGLSEMNLLEIKALDRDAFVLRFIDRAEMLIARIKNCK